MQKIALSSLLLMMACSDASFTKTNALPTANITYPSDNEIFLEGYSYTLRGMIGDPNHGFPDLRSNWLINGEPHCENVQPDSGGLSQCLVIFDPEDTEITLEVFDPSGGSAVDYATITVNPTEAPIANITAPLNGAILYATQATILEGNISDQEDAPDALTSLWTSSIDGALDGEFNTPDSSGSLIGATFLSAGDHILTLEVTDSTGKNTRDVIILTVLEQNTPPSCNITFPNNGDVLSGNTPIAFSALVSDAETGPSNLSVSWNSNVDGLLGQNTVNNDNSVLLAISQLSLGPHTITLMAEDDAGGSCEDSIDFIVNTAPTSPTVYLSPNNPDTTMDITAQSSGSVDADGDSVSYQYAWMVNGATTNVLTDTFPNNLTTKGDQITVSVTPHDGISNGTPGQSSTSIVNAPPTIQNHQLSHSTAVVGDIVICSANTSDPDPIDILNTSYIWSNGATGSSYTIQSSDVVNSLLSCSITVDDGDGGTVQSSASLTIANSTPQTSVTINPTSPNGNDPLTCVVTASDANNHALSHNVSWTLNGQSITHTVLSSTESQVIGNFSSQDLLTCSVTTSDGFGGSASDTTSVTIVNTPPTMTTPLISPTTIYTNDTIVATTVTSDGDGDPLTLTHDWTVNGQIIQSGVLSTLDGSLSNTFDKYDTVYVTTTVSDGLSTLSQSSLPVTIENSLPTAANISLVPSIPTSGDGLQCILDMPSLDDDGDSISYTIDWTINGSPYSGAATTLLPNDTIPVGITQSTDIWECTLTPNDGDDDGLSSSVSTVVTETCDAIITFNGGSDRITLDPLTTMPNDKTMEAWIRLDAPPSGEVQLMSSQCAAVWITPTEINVGTINGCLGASGGCKSGYTNSTSWINNNRPGGDGGFLFTDWDGTWKHIAVTITSTEVATLYVDGVFFDSAILSSDGCISATTIGTIGRHNVYGGSLVGDVAEVRMSSSIEYYSTFTPQYPLPVTSATEVLYGLQNDVGMTSLTDDSGNGVNAAINGTTWDFGGPTCP